MFARVALGLVDCSLVLAVAFALLQRESIAQCDSTVQVAWTDALETTTFPLLLAVDRSAPWSAWSRHGALLHCDATDEPPAASTAWFPWHDALPAACHHVAALPGLHSEPFLVEQSPYEPKLFAAGGQSARPLGQDIAVSTAHQQDSLSPVMAPGVVSTSGGEGRYRLDLSARGRGEPPPGTMFIWTAPSASAGAFLGDASGARHAPRAGVVLSRPQGEYSQDWIGVAISAAIY